MITSNKVINYLKKNLIKENYVSMFLAGSQPKVLIPQSDLDIFIIIKNKRRNEFFNNLTKIMDNLILKNKEITYILTRGPNKRKFKGLVHFLIYTEEKCKEKVRESAEANPPITSDKIGKFIPFIYFL